MAENKDKIGDTASETAGSTAKETVGKAELTGGAAGNIDSTKSKNKNQKKGPKGKKKKAPIIIAVIVILFLIIRIAGRSLADSQIAIVTTTQALRGDLQESIITSGTVLSEEVKVIFAPVSGTLGEVNVEAGDSVKEGDILISYDMDQMERTLRSSALQLERSTAGYDATLANNTANQAKLNEANINLGVLNQQIVDNEAYLKNLQNSLSQSQRETSNALAAEALEIQQQMNSLDLEERYSDTYAELSNRLARNSYLQQMAASSDYVAQMQQEISDVQERLAGYQEYKARMESQKTASEAAALDSYGKTQLNVDKEMADLSYQETEREYYIAKAGITAGFDGIVTSCMALPGAGVAQGTQLLTLESSRNLKVAFDASQYDLEKLKLGQQADVVIFGRTYHGEVSRINRMAERNASSTPMVGVEIHLTDADDNIILGLDARLTIYTNEAQNALLIPVEAINADRDGDFLYVVEEGIVVRKPILCGISTDTYTEVLEGITENDVIILSSLIEIEEGMPVAVLQDGLMAGGSTAG